MTRAMRCILATAVAVTIVGSGGAAPAQAAFPGDNGRIVFDTVFRFFFGLGPSQIYSVRPSGEGLRQLTHVPDGSAAWHPAVSPAANKIAFVMSSDGVNDQVWIMRADGSHQRPLVDEPDWSSTGPTFSADGRRVLYSRCGSYVPAYFTCRIVSVRLDGTHPRTIVGGLWHPSDPAVSPDGSTVAFVSDQGGYDARLWLTDAAGTSRHTIGPRSGGVERVSWSPDGSHLVFTGSRIGGVHTIAADGSDLTTILAGSLFGSWSPNGARIASTMEAPDPDFGPLRITWVDGSHPRVVVGAGMGIGYSDWGVAR